MNEYIFIAGVLSILSGFCFYQGTRKITHLEPNRIYKLPSNQPVTLDNIGKITLQHNFKPFAEVDCTQGKVWLIKDGKLEETK